MVPNKTARSTITLTRRWLLWAILLTGYYALSLEAVDFWNDDDERRQHFQAIWEYRLNDFSAADYEDAVGFLMKRFEVETGKSLRPAENGRAGIKVYTNSGYGLCTPHALTDAVIFALEERGFSRQDLFILDAKTDYLRHSGYLPPLSKRDKVGRVYNGVPVYALDTDEYYHPDWFYESTLPPESAFLFTTELLGSYEGEDDPEDRKSYLPYPLLKEVDFWINLPMVIDSQGLGISGALVNATLYNVSNRHRFFVSPANAPIAIAEMAAIPELASNWAFTIMTLEHYQFIGGPSFNSYYTHSEPLLWLSVDPVILDSLMLDRMNNLRASRGFEIIAPRLPQLEYARSLGMGTVERDNAVFLPVP